MRQWMTFSQILCEEIMRTETCVFYNTGEISSKTKTCPNHQIYLFQAYIYFKSKPSWLKMAKIN